MAGGAIVLRRKFSASAFWDDARKYRACFHMPKRGTRALTPLRARTPRHAAHASIHVRSASRIDCSVISGATGFIYIGELCRYLYAQPPSPKDNQHPIRFMIGTSSFYILFIYIYIY
jgi:acyl-CoA synthetase (AMP-forming)/AMP-acid ligase II